MTSENQRIAIATACGWTHVGLGTQAYQSHYGPSVICGMRPGSCYGIVPDYLNDSNAINEALKVLTEEQWNAYVCFLLEIIWRPDVKQFERPVGGWWRITEFEMTKLLSASAAQKAEAFLKALNLWTP